ncbi:MAG: phage/plasmid primase, P4 family [Candidatus Sulfotelmatobacter sp.]
MSTQTEAQEITDSVRTTLTLRHAAENHYGHDTIFVTRLPGGDVRACKGIDEATALVTELEQDPATKAIWTNLQQFKPNSEGRKKANCIAYRNVVLDIDRRMKTDKDGNKVNATEEERAVLLAKVEEINAYMKTTPMGSCHILADSGNGYHMNWCMESFEGMVTPEQSKKAYASLLALLRAKFESPDVNMEIDQSLADETQVVTVWGTWNRKYPNTPERPQRQSKVIYHRVTPIYPTDLMMTLDTLKKEAKESGFVGEAAPASEASRGDYPVCTEDWLENYGAENLIEWGSPFIELIGTESKDDGEYYFYTPCLAHSNDKDGYEHDPSDAAKHSAIIEKADGGLAHSCWSQDLTIGGVIHKLEKLKGEKYPHQIFEQEPFDPSLLEGFAEQADDATVPNGIADECREFGCNCSKCHQERKTVLTITPEEQKEIDRIRKEATLQTFEKNDLGNAARFELRHGGEFLWTSATHWLYYKNGLWVEDKTHKADQAMVHTIHKIEEEAELTTDEDEKAAIKAFAAASKSNKKIKDALERSEKRACFARDYSDFDRHEQFFHVANGEYNLETGTLVDHHPDFLATKGSKIKYDPTAECPGFEKYLREVMGGNENLIAYLRRCVGYTLTVATGEAAMFILTGRGGTGKTTFLNVLRGVLGTYAKRAQRGTFMAKRGDEGQPFDYAGLEGCRAFISSETEEGKQIAVSKVKELTGNEESLTACRKFKDSYEFKPKCKVWLACNDFPKAPAGDEALWDRLKPIPFNVRFRDTKEEVKDLSAKLIEEEGSGILNWALRGLEEYMEIGLAVPEEAKQCAEELREEQDFLGRFLEERTAKTYDNAEMVKTSKLYETFRSHADITGEGRGWTRQRFNAEMRSKGYEDKKVRVGDKTAEAWIGVKLVNSYTAETFAMADTEQL